MLANQNEEFQLMELVVLPCKPACKARFKRRILHAPNRIAKLSACKMRCLNQLNATCFNSMRVSRIYIRLIQSNIRLKFDI